MRRLYPSECHHMHTNKAQMRAHAASNLEIALSSCCPVPNAAFWRREPGAGDGYTAGLCVLASHQDASCSSGSRGMREP